MKLADESGMTLVELLIAAVISLCVLGATLTTFNSYYEAEHANDARNDTTELARNALDAEARQLRNLAKRVSSPVIDTLGPDDLIFQTSDPTRTWVRYCLDTTRPPASAARARLWTAELTVADATAASPVSTAMHDGCPGREWTRTAVVADYVTNRRAGHDRPLFRYTCAAGTSCGAGAATYDQVVDITAQILLDTTPGFGVPEQGLQTSVHLRNQNQAPVASFASSRSSTSRGIVLNAGGSSDHEGRTLQFYWFKQALPAVAQIDCAHPVISGAAAPRTLWGAAGYIGKGITLTHTFPASDGLAGTTRNVGLVVCDPGDRFGTAGVPPQATIPVQIPA
jgi:type II secretory pathway pseudopilin PulG